MWAQVVAAVASAVAASRQPQTFQDRFGKGATLEQRGTIPPGTTDALKGLTGPEIESLLVSAQQQQQPPQGERMSLFGDSNFDLGGLLNTGLQFLQQRTASRATPPPQLMTTSLMPASLPVSMGMLPAVGGAVVRAAPAVAGAVMAGGRAIARSAMTYCRRHPGWCASIGGTAAVSAMIESGQLPTIRRRRGRGITPRDLRSFKRVANLIRVFCPTVRRIPSRATRHVRGTGITHA